MTSAGTSAIYAYNGDGLRTSKTVSGTAQAFVWDVSVGLPQLLKDGTTSYVYGPDGLPLERIDAAGTVLYYHHDQLGSTRVLTDANGAVVGTYTYDPYGKPTASTGTVSQPFGYAGQYADAETGFQYLRARYYDPATGQFLSRDPLEAQTRSAYGYVGGNPLNGTDPSGLKPFWQQALSVGSTVAGAAAVGLGIAAVVVTAPVSVPVVGVSLGTAAVFAAGTSVVLSTAQAAVDCSERVDARCVLEGAGAAAGAVSFGTAGVGARLAAQGFKDFGQAANIFSAGAGVYGFGIGLGGFFGGPRQLGRGDCSPLSSGYNDGPGYTGSGQCVDWSSGGVPFAR